MTRTRATSGTAGRIVFVGAGPGDPGMLTARATEALTATETSGSRTPSARSTRRPS